MYKFYIILLFPILVFSQDTITKPQHSVISLDKMNVVYRGISNPISIAVNDAKSYKVFGNDLKQEKNGNYYLFTYSDSITKVNVEITNNDNSIIIEEHEFKIKNFPRLITIFKNNYSTNGTIIFSKKDFVNAEIGIKFLDFFSDLKFEVKSFSFCYKEKLLIVTGNKINVEVIDLLKKVRVNDFVTIDNIKYSTSDNSMPRRVESLKIQIIE